MQNVFYIQNTYRKQLLKMVKLTEDGISFVRETDGDVQSSGSVLTNSILCCCSCFHGAPSPSLPLLPSLTACLSPHAHKRTFTRTQVSEMEFSHVSKSASNCYLGVRIPHSPADSHHHCFQNLTSLVILIIFF